MVILKPKGFGIAELMPPETLKSLGEEACWKRLHPNLLLTLDQLKKFFGYSMIINTWSFKNWQKFGSGKDPYRYRCYRPVGCGVGAVNGAHYKGLGVDIDFYKDGVLIPANIMRKSIITNRDKFNLIKGLEDKVSWCHVDCLDRGGKLGKICLFDAKNKVTWI